MRASDRLCVWLQLMVTAMIRTFFSTSKIGAGNERENYGPLLALRYLDVWSMKFTIHEILRFFVKQILQSSVQMHKLNELTRNRP